MKVLNKDQEHRLREVIKSKIRKLREMPEMRPEEEEEEDYAQAPEDGMAPEAPAMADPVAAPEANPAGFSSAEAPQPPDAVSPQDAAPVDAAPVSPEAPAMEDPMAGDPSMEDPAVDGGDDKIRQAKVRLFFDKLASNPTLVALLKFRSPLEQAEAIHQFATLVGVPKSQVLPLLKQIKDTAQEPTAEPAMESRRRRKKR